jgi:hypothetical protein
MVQKCDVCARERTVQDVMEYAPVQAVMRQPLGWYSAADSEMCSECVTLMIRGSKK